MEAAGAGRSTSINKARTSNDRPLTPIMMKSITISGLTKEQRARVKAVKGERYAGWQTASLLAPTLRKALIQGRANLTTQEGP